ncbi:MAG TPA: protein kinase [Polyangiales bacterium]|nr:protein kinase [Polyangiales bacterium]
MVGDADDKRDDESEDSELESVLRKAACVDDQPARGAPPWRGQIIGGKYRIEGLMGRGGMGAVFRATHVVTEKAVALKWMLHSGSEDQARRRFVREALAAGRIDHPNVVDVYDVGHEGDSTFLVMELLHGQTLRALAGRPDADR